MTLQTQHTVNAPATLTDEQRRRVSDALENAQSVEHSPELCRPVPQVPCLVSR